MHSISAKDQLPSKGFLPSHQPHVAAWLSSKPHCRPLQIVIGLKIFGLGDPAWSSSLLHLSSNAFLSLSRTCPGRSAKEVVPAPLRIISRMHQFSHVQPWLCSKPLCCFISFAFIFISGVIVKILLQAELYRRSARQAFDKGPKPPRSACPWELWAWPSSKPPSISCQLWA